MEPGYTFGTVTEKISAIVLTRPASNGWFVGFGIAFLLTMMMLYAIGYLFLKGVGIWGVTIPIGWGFAIVNFVWWIGIGHAGTLISAILLLAAAVVAQFHQPFRRSHDAVCRGLRRNLSRHPRRTSVAGLLAVSLSQHHGRVAAIPQPAHVGRFRGLHLRHDFGAVLVHRPDSRHGDAARSRDASRGQNRLRHALDGLARIGAALASL